MSLRVQRSEWFLGDLEHYAAWSFFPAEELRGLRCWAVERPFQKHLIFYRYDETTLYAERIVHGARDLPARLTEPPGSEEE